MGNRKSGFKNIVSSVDDASRMNTASDPVRDFDVPPIIQSQIAQNYVIVWLHLDTNYSDRDRDRSIHQLQCVAKSIDLFTDKNQCIDFITDIMDKEVFLIISGPSIQQFVANIEDISKLYSIYIFDTQDTYNEVDFQQSRKVRGIFLKIRNICDALQQDTARRMADLISFSIVPITPSSNPNELDQSFMYTQLIKEIVLEIEPNDNEKQQFVSYLRNSGKSEASSELLEKFQRSYKANDAILWYARESFLYATINKALRLQDTKTIIKMAFFLRDLHRQIERKHSKTRHTKKMIVYRGQGMSNADFENMKKNEGGLFSFNSFLSTSTDPRVPHMFLGVASQNSEMVDILFRIEIDPLASSTPFAKVNNIDNSGSNEQEILFSMHTVFRIGQMHQLKDKDRSWEVNLTLTSDNNSQLKYLTDFIRDEVSVANVWYRLAFLMMQMGKLEDAMEIFNTLQRTAFKEADGSSTIDITQPITIMINAYLNESTQMKSESLVHVKETLDCWENTLTPDDPLFGLAYMSVAQVYQSNFDYATALTYMEKSLKVFQQYSHCSESILAVIYIRIGELCRLIGDHQLALSHLEKALDLLQKSHPSNHPRLAVVYTSIASTYAGMNNNAKAVLYMERASAILQSLPSDHPFLLVNYFYMGQVQQSMGNYQTALSYIQKASKVGQDAFPPDHPNHAVIYNSLAVLHRLMKDYKTAISYSRKALKIQENCATIHHPNLASTYIYLAATYQSTGDYKTSLTYLEKALAIQKISLSPDHPDLVANLKMIGELNHLMGNHEVALSYYEQVLEIWEKSSPMDQSNLANIYNKIGAAHQSMGRCPMATQYFEKAYEIQKKSLPFDDPNLIETYKNIASSRQLRGDLVSTVSNWEKMYQVGQKYLSNNRSSHSQSSDNPESEHQRISYTSEAISKLKQVAESQQKLFSSDRGVADCSENDIDELRQMVNNCSDSVENFKAANQASFTSDNPFTNNVYNDTDIDNQNTNNFFNILSSALKNTQSLFSINHAASATADNGASTTLSTIEKILIAQQSLQQLMESVQELHSPNDPSAATYYDYIGSAICSMGDYWNALPYFEKALEIIHTSFSNNHPLLAKTYSDKAKALDGCGRYKEAVDCAEQAMTIARQNFESTTAEIEAYENQWLQLLQKTG